MSSEITCPVCSFAHIPPDEVACPQCDSDLICFKLLDTLGEERLQRSVPDHTKEKRGYKLLWVQLLLGVLLVCLGGYGGYRFSAMDSLVKKIQSDVGQVTHLVNQTPHKVSKEILQQIPSQLPLQLAGQISDQISEKVSGQLTEQLSIDLASVTGEVARLEKQVEALVGLAQAPQVQRSQMGSSPEKNGAGAGPELPGHKPENLGNQPKIPGDQPEGPCFKLYQAKEDDTLWDIARDLYGSGIFYPLLMEHNPDASVYGIGSRTTLRYLCDRTLAPPLYREIIGRDQNRPYWKYRVRPGDTRDEIIKRYCRNETDCLVQDKPLTPGMTMGVFLE